MYTRPCSAVTVTVTATVTVSLVWAYAYDQLIEFQFRRVAAISCKSVYAYMYGCYGDDLNRVDTLTHGHVCACLCCFSSFKFAVMLQLICVRYLYSILVDIWLISTPGVFLKIGSGGSWWRVWHYFNVFPCEWMDSKWTIIGVTLLMEMSWKYDVNDTIWMNNGMEVIIVTLWLYIGQHDDATRDGLVTPHVTSPRHVEFI